MNRIVASIFLFLSLWGTSPNARSQGASDGLILPLGMVEVNLPAGWEPLIQPTNIFIQQRAKNEEKAMIFTAGAFNAGLELDQFVAVTIGAMGSDNMLSGLAKILKRPEGDVEKLMASLVGTRYSDQLKNATAELIGGEEIEILGYKAFEIRSKVNAVGQSGYMKQYVMRGKYPKHVIMIALASVEESVLADETVVACIRRSQRTAPVPVAPVAPVANPAPTQVLDVNQAAANYVAAIEQISKDISGVETAEEAAKCFKTYIQVNNSLVDALETFHRNNPGKRNAPEYLTAGSAFNQVTRKYTSLLPGFAKLMHQFESDQQVVALVVEFEKSLQRQSDLRTVISR